MALSRGEQYEHPLWKRKRDEILDRDEDTCQICGSSKHSVEVHHLCYFPDHLIWEYDNELLQTVCLKHHEQLTYDLPKLAGLIAFEALKNNIDLNELYEIIKAHGKNKNNKAGILSTFRPL